MMMTTMTTAMSNDLVQATKDSLKALDVQRQSLEQEADAITSELTDSSGENGKPPMGIDTPLVDSDGYPRADIDLYRARSLRGRLAQIRTNHKALMKDIERTLQQLASLQSQQKESSEDQQQDETQKKEQAARLQTKPKPKYDAATGKWVVCNWDGTVAGVAGGEHRSFHEVSSSPDQAAALSRLAISNASLDTATTTTTTTTTTTPSNSSNGTTSASSAPAAPSLSSLPMTRPFCRVNSVAPHSPAAGSGLRPEDLILRFGPISVEEYGSGSSSDPMSAVAQLVPQAAASQSSIELVVQRPRPGNSSSSAVTSAAAAAGGDNSNRVTLHLQPRPWNGRGLLGCHIVPMTSD